tara:strand:- start:187 stop:705 length:519 start_codon:yes stop_codon:yes gene_type:complete
VADKALDSVGEGSGFLKSIAILAGVVVIFWIIAAFFMLYLFEPGFGGTTKNAPEGSMVASEDENGVWKILVVKINPQVSINSVHWYLLDPSGNTTKADGLVTDIYGYKQGQGKAIRFVDEDFNGKLSPGDKFLIHPSEPNSDLEEIDDFSGFSFRMKFEPTGDVIGYDLQFE